MESIKTEIKFHYIGSITLEIAENRKLIQANTSRKKILTKNEQNLRDMCDNINQCNICVIRILGGEEK